MQHAEPVCRIPLPQSTDKGVTSHSGLAEHNNECTRILSDFETRREYRVWLEALSSNTNLSVEPVLRKRPVDPVDVGQLVSIIDANLCCDNRFEPGVHRKDKITIHSSISSQVRIFARIHVPIIKFKVVIPVQLKRAAGPSAAHIGVRDIHRHVEGLLM